MPLVRHRHHAWRHVRALATAAVQPAPTAAAAAGGAPSISHELSNLKSSLFHLLGSSHPSLDAVAKYYFQAEGKHLRPMIVLLMSRATNGLGGTGWDRMRVREAEEGGVDESLTSVQGVLNDWNPERTGREAGEVFAEPYRVGERARRERTPRAEANTTEFDDILSTQRRLASITEMIHVASLLHDDVIDNSPLRRGAPSAPQQFSNKLSILAGDFLLGRASVALARLGNREVVELLATVVANLVEGEVMQMRSGTGGEPSQEAFEVYMRKTYLKTASLMAKSARASVILGGCGEGSAREVEQGERVKDIAYAYGRNLGIAFQVSRAGLGHGRLLTLPAAHRRPARLFTTLAYTRETITRRRPITRADDRARPLRMAHEPGARAAHCAQVCTGRGCADR